VRARRAFLELIKAWSAKRLCRFFPFFFPWPSGLSASFRCFFSGDCGPDSTPFLKTRPVQRTLLRQCAAPPPITLRVLFPRALWPSSNGKPWMCSWFSKTFFSISDGGPSLRTVLAPKTPPVQADASSLPSRPFFTTSSPPRPLPLA